MTDGAIVQRLLSEGSSAAWETFLRRFSNLILKIIWQFEKDHDEVMEKYLFVCGKLAANDFAILRRFEQREGAPQFTTWLAAVTHNLCIDAHRSVHGRRQLPRAILRLPEFDREVFRLYYWKGFSREEIEHHTANVPNRSTTAVAESFERIESAGFSSPPESEASQVPYDEETLVVGSGETESDFAEMLQWMERWLGELNDQERMIVRLWFWEGMNGRDIAAAMKILPEHRVYSLLKKTLARLRHRAEQTYSDQRTRNISV